MKFNVQERKAIEKEVQAILKGRGYKGRIGQMYRIDKEVYIEFGFFFPTNRIISFDTQVKKYSYDNIYWEIMNMIDNKKMPDSFRAWGAFKAWSITIDEFEYVFIDKENYIKDIVKIIERFEKKVNEFIAKNDINEYVLSHMDTRDGGDLTYGNELKCLAYCDRGEYGKSKKVAIEELEKGKSGGFVNEGKNFYEWVVEYTNRKIEVEEADQRRLILNSMDVMADGIDKTISNLLSYKGEKKINVNTLCELRETLIEIQELLKDKREISKKLACMLFYLQIQLNSEIKDYDSDYLITKKINEIEDLLLEIFI